MKKFIKDKIIVIGIVIVLILFPILTGLFLIKPSIFKNFTTNNDWIGFLGSYTGAIIGGLITLFVLDKTIKSGESNLEKSIDSNKKLDLCRDVANAVAEYCTIARKKRHMSFKVNITTEYLNEIEYELNKTKEGSKRYNELSKEHIEELSNLNCKLSEFNLMDTTTSQFLLTIKLAQIQEAQVVLKKIDNINNLITDEKISHEKFEKHIISLLNETSKFINQYS